MEDGIKRWTAKRKAALVMEIIECKTTVAEGSRSFDIAPSGIEVWVDDAKRGMENALRAKPLEIQEQYKQQIKDLQKAYGETMLELRARKCKLRRSQKSSIPCWASSAANDAAATASTQSRRDTGQPGQALPVV
jgi:transposase-like protein